ncbi:MAG: hypothetical protein CBD16_01840 [Betaproteobacteria bacterium TMED156]|nr:MAG: hypothetical protein CBD16_01840 [Betaproteobacteria bacterium TMED156]
MACLVLAAGESSRFGSIKQLAPINNQPMLLKKLKELKKIFHSDLFVVLGAFKEKIQPVIINYANIIINEHWEDGMSSSISAGINKITANKEYTSVLIALADQIKLTSNDYSILLNSFDGVKITATKYQHNIGVPAIFPLNYFEHLERFKGDNGARFFLNNNQNEINVVTLHSETIDIDTVEDYVAFRNNQT